jgi:aliphatic nitrilase
MNDRYSTVKVAAVQAASVLLNREATVEKACALIREAGSNGARVIAFPEGFIPGHPNWYHHHPATSREATGLAVELFKSSVEVPSPATDRLCQAARHADAYVVMGICEKLPNTLGTMFNSQIYISPEGRLIGKHQKFMPTVGERIVHALGYGDTFGTFTTEFGPMSGLVCGENANPLAALALTSEGTRIHSMSYPAYFAPTFHPMRDRVLMDAQSFANISSAYVIAACGAVDKATLDILKPSAADLATLSKPEFTGGSVIVGPNGRIVAGPLGSEEAILYGECDIETSIRLKLVQDFAGHYNRPDIFQLVTNRGAPRIHSVRRQDETTGQQSNVISGPSQGSIANPTVLHLESQSRMSQGSLPSLQARRPDEQDEG